MKLRLALVSLLVALSAAAVSWATYQPVFGMLFDTIRSVAVQIDTSVLRFERALPALALLDVAVVTVGVFALLYFSVGRPLGRAQEVVEQLASNDEIEGLQDEGALLSRLGPSLKRLARALDEERARNATQLSELQRANEELTRLQTELVGADRLATVGRLAAGVAHEVGNPLSGILGYVSVLRSRGAGNSELLDLIDRVEAEVLRIDRIVRSLLELGRPSRGGVEPFDVKPVVDAAVQLLSASSELRGVLVSVEGPLQLYVKGEAGPFSQVLVNLLLNAGQAMGGQGKAWVRFRELNGRCILEVDDDGPGISPDAMAHLFELFFTTKSAGKGTGLGLAMSRHLLGQFGGTLEGANRPEGGARFTITLPLV